MITLILTFVILFTINSYSQNCYIELTDLSGSNIHENIQQLEEAACILKLALPEEFRPNFHVYNFGFYSLTEYLPGGYETVFNQMKNIASSNSTYYIIFGVQVQNSRGELKIWIDFNLPNVEYFHCIRDWEHIKYQVRNIGSGNLIIDELPNSEIEIMNYFRLKIECKEICDNLIDDDDDGWIDCNDPDCEEYNRKNGRSLCTGQAVFSEYPDQLFGFDDNKIEAYPTYKTELGDGIPWKSLGVGVEDQVFVNFSQQLDLKNLTYVATGVEIIGNLEPQNYTELIKIKGISSTQYAKIEVKDMTGTVIGGLNIKVLEPKSMVLNLILMKLPTDNSYPVINFTESFLQSVLNNTYKQINLTYTVNQIDKYEHDFDLDDNNIMDMHLFEDNNCLQYLYNNEQDLYRYQYYPSEYFDLFNKTATIFLYHTLQTIDEKGALVFTNGGMPTDGVPYICGAVDCDYQHNIRTICHELGHRISLFHPWKEFENTYIRDSDGFSLMEYVDPNYGYKIRAYQW